jgi:tetratricopeptide (TPR) repeat protein
MNSLPFKPAIILIFCLYSICSNAQNSSVLHQSFGQQYHFVDSMNGVALGMDSVQAFELLSGLEKWAMDNGDKQLANSFVLLRYKYIVVKKGKNNKALEEGLQDFIEKMKGEKLKYLQAEAMEILADYYLKDYSMSAYAFDNMLRAYDIYSNEPTDAFPPKGEYLFNLAINHMRFKEYAGAGKYLAEVKEISTEKTEPKIFNVLNAIGLCYRNLGIYDTAEMYFKDAYQKAGEAGNSEWPGIIAGNLGITYYYEGRYAEAIPLIEKDINATKRPNVNTAKSMALLGDIYLMNGDKNKAMEQLLAAYQIIKDKRKWGEYEVLQIIYSKLAKAYAATGNLQLAYTYMDSAMLAKDSVASQKNVYKLARVQQEQEHEKYEAEVEKLNDQRKLHVLERNSLIGGIVLLAVIALLFINRQRLKNNEREQKLLAEKQVAEAERKMAEADLQNASRQLGDFTRNIQEKNELIEKFSAEVERLQALPCSVELPDTKDNLLKLQQSTILTEEQWEDFRNMFEKVHSGFFIRLREKLPDLSPAEIRFVALSKLNMNNKEMASVLGISTDAVRMNRHRLKKKLNLPEEDSLEKLIEAI